MRSDTHVVDSYYQKVGIRKVTVAYVFVLVKYSDDLRRYDGYLRHIYIYKMNEQTPAIFIQPNPLLLSYAYVPSRPNALLYAINT